MLLSPPLLSQIRVFIARRRRFLAAICAGLATLLILSVLVDTADPTDAAAIDSRPSQQLASGEVAVPILLADAKLAGGVDPGDVVDLVELSDIAPAVVIAEHARVLSKGSGGSTFSVSEAQMLVVAVRKNDALSVASAGAAASLTLVMQSKIT
ncbi:MAG: hypothetical protein Q7L55_07350 [Actinomycetota bacterium]|nr:hypothetical protein [Actinomycetota bacterium]